MHLTLQKQNGLLLHRPEYTEKEPLQLDNNREIDIIKSRTSVERR